MNRESGYENILMGGEEVVTVTLNRPEIHNPFDDKTILELTDCFSRIKADDTIRLVIITGAGKSFCAGADLNWMKKMAEYPEHENVADAGRLSDMLVALSEIPVPTIARVNGVALGGGAGLVCACDFSISSDNAQFAFSEVKLGILPGVVSPYVIERVGVKRAVQLFTSGERINAEKAREIGIVDRVVPGEKLNDEVEDLVDLILTGGPNAVKECKKLARTYALMDRDSFKKYSIEAIADARASDEGREGIRAFLDKRKPAWRTTDED